ncbi:TPA: T4SS effector ferrous iron transporter IroT/MavN [Legionella pneumophila]|uniref:T4SS effector ferrous iron transporter IroT/MavN n=1 Tax=Legionella pneumophila TaxID=446 RepID=UPI000788DCA4|nr:T4SS effector ferrous iron transporter IroT/MavN [Legionella pneumophila]MDW8878621.1 T4SS effector ferrous iron transporter IroT/MavN [Legionella pneumophila subsp. fraseri]MDW8963504.1 T4SS effector ferrous iron transporter IroT/MavN [Legionella pneumophila subsp. fraseri]MDW9035347.1 T4SS effector ferrous iron transporter IroT/MavN [Legionella pneumophila subsp. fraseri]MDW9038408.1 T4SS effector ferrous iron transporter IroT/MavN [Legionella pneumophila subsp. fraseri]MDW9041469.1 T4SS 
MNIKNIPIKPQKIPYYLFLLLLTTGASLILGFLSFGGMYALLPALPLAFAGFALSVAYEGEIYLQNIKGALNKLFKFNYLKNYLAKEYLLTHFPKTDEENCPQFFKDYKRQLELLGEFGHKELNQDSKKRKRQIEKTLSDMEKWFALQLFSDKNNPSQNPSKYTKELLDWLALNKQDEWIKRWEKRHFQFHIVKGFSVVAGLFMGLGSTYLIVEAFTVIPFFAAIPFTLWPIIILPMAIVAGAAYGMLTYNAVTDMINNNTVVKWYNKIRDDLSQGLTVRNVFIATTAVFLVGLALALTVCTAGTWWTIATNARPLFDWMKKMPSFIMGVINPIITGASAIVFNIQNTAESLDMVDEATRSNKNIFQKIYETISNGYQHLRETENWLQIVNPFRILLKLTITPLRILLFMGHLISVAVTSDRMPGVPQILSALVAIISEGFEDAHYFIGHSHEEEHDEEYEHHNRQQFEKLLKDRLDPESGHDHNMDIPTWILKTVASPLYGLAALWDFSASKLNPSEENHTRNLPSAKIPSTLSLREAWNKQWGVAKEFDVKLNANAERPSQEWQVEHAVARIEKFQRKHLKDIVIGRELADKKIVALNQLKEKIRHPEKSETLSDTLEQAKKQPDYNQHRLFNQKGEKTRTQIFIEELPERVNLSHGQ